MPEKMDVATFLALDHADTVGAEEEEVEEEEVKISIFDILDAPRELPEPIDITQQHLKQIADELGIITLCWPELEHVYFEDRVHFPQSYLKNSNKEKLMLFATENFRKQYHHKFPHRKQLFLAAENECGLQKMVCTTLRPTTIPYTEIETWENCCKFVGDQLKYEPLEMPTLIVRIPFLIRKNRTQNCHHLENYSVYNKIYPSE